ncbi:ASCH domain-containing protein [Streptococcus hyointestinalis]|uniref:ASCH domain-containing protein n=1 Tax=Streptococcus hyointestinalis TaxID=1337 RepID=UPI003512C24C
MWQDFLATRPDITQDMDAWAFGVEADTLADLVLKGVKTATASAYDLYELDKEALPQEGTYDVVLDSKDEAVCIIEITKVSLVPFSQVSAQHAYKEGEGDRSLAYWQKVHETIFSKWFEECGLTFSHDSVIVLEEFAVVYPKKEDAK